jgi:hypothetical protein
MQKAEQKLRQWAKQPPLLQTRRERLEHWCDWLFRSIGLQTSIAKYQASGAERGCILDFVDYPLNNRWWLEDQFRKVRTLPTEEQRVAELVRIAAWENPEGCLFYDDVGSVAKSPHVVSEAIASDDPNHVGGVRPLPEPSFAWWDNGMSRQRLSWQCYMDWPQAIRYLDLDPKANYKVRMTGYNEALLRIDGQRVTPNIYGKQYGEIKEFPVPSELVTDGTIELTWDRPDERHLNWRQHSRVTEVWLLINTDSHMKE